MPGSRAERLDDVEAPTRATDVTSSGPTRSYEITSSAIGAMDAASRSSRQPAMPQAISSSEQFSATQRPCMVKQLVQSADWLVRQSV